MKNVIVIGGGAAGMMAAYWAAYKGAKVTLIEKNEKLGKKIFITGKGRCNVTNAADMDVLFSNVCTNEKFLYSAFYQFDNQMVMDFFEKAGCPLKVERGDRVFPVSDHSSDVIGALQRELKKVGAEICLNTTVEGLVTDGDDTKLTGVIVKNGKMIPCDACIVCTGGISYASTGSTGDGYIFAKQTGHNIIDTYPALVPFEAQEEWCKELQGLALKNVSFRLMCGNKEIYSDFGEMLFTHFGISGPLIISASSYYVKHMARLKKKNINETVTGFIDLKPALDFEQLDKRVLRDFDESKNKQFKNVLGGLFPSKLIPVMIKLSGIEPDTKVNEITKAERNAFVRLIKELPVTITKTRDFNEAIITQGGVSVKDINPSTMESKKVKNLFFAGEVLDLDALTGGFNLQIAWSTGYLAGVSVTKE